MPVRKKEISAGSAWFMLFFVSPNHDLDQKPPDEAANVGAMHWWNLLTYGCCSPSSWRKQSLKRKSGYSDMVTISTLEP